MSKLFRDRTKTTLLFCFIAVGKSASAQVSYCAEVEKDSGIPNVAFEFGPGFKNKSFFNFKYPLETGSLGGAVDAIATQVDPDSFSQQEIKAYIAETKKALPLEAGHSKALKSNIKDLMGLLKEKCCPLSGVTIGFLIKKVKHPDFRSNAPAPVVGEIVITGCPSPESSDFRSITLMRDIQSVCIDKRGPGDYINKDLVRDKFRSCIIALESVEFQGPEKFKKNIRPGHGS